MDAQELLTSILWHYGVRLQGKWSADHFMYERLDKFRQEAHQAGQEDMRKRCDTACTEVIESCRGSSEAADRNAGSGASICRAQIRGLPIEVDHNQPAEIKKVR